MEVRVGPPSLTIHADEQFLACAPDASVGSAWQLSSTYCTGCSGSNATANKRLTLTPRLADWIGQVELAHLRVGGASL
jgi:hypothetical protein